MIQRTLLPFQPFTARAICSHLKKFSSVPDGRLSSLRRELPYLDKFNPFLKIPEAFVTSLNQVDDELRGIVQLHPDVFRVFPRLDILHSNVKWQQDYRSLSFFKQLTKGEMPGPKKKPWPQSIPKRGGVGRSRHSSHRSPVWKYGGFAHGFRGPVTKFYMLPDALRLQGLCIALTVKHAQDDLVIVDDFDTLSSDHPDDLQEIAEQRNWGYSVLFMADSDTAPRNLALACSTIPSFNILPSYGLNCLSMLRHDTLVLSLRSLEQIESAIMQQLNRASSLIKKYRYIDMKSQLDEDYLDSAEQRHKLLEEYDEREEFAPFI